MTKVKAESGDSTVHFGTSSFSSKDWVEPFYPEGTRPAEFQYGVEIRNKGWLKPDFAALCRSHSAALVLTDYMWMPLGDEIEQLFDPLTAAFGYVRLIGNRKEIEAITRTWDREVIDREERLERWAAFLGRQSHRAEDIYVYVNNHYAGHVPAMVQRLQQRYLALNKREN